MLSRRGKPICKEERWAAAGLFRSTKHCSRKASELFLVVLALLMPFACFIASLKGMPFPDIRRLANHYTGLFTRATHPPSLPVVMVLTTDAAYQFDVTSTVEPRGYTVTWERKPEDAVARLRTAPERFKIVVVDGVLPGSDNVVRMIGRSWPDMHVIVSRGPRRAAVLAQSLLKIL